MRTFIVSDLHGNGEVYESMMKYLENISLFDDVELYINGDLIDRGLNSYTMFNDVINRIEGKGDILIHYLGGNHELMMYQALKKRKHGEVIDHWCDWMLNGGWVIEGEFDALEEDAEEKIEKYQSFLGNLKIYHKFPDIISNNQILLVHAQAPNNINDVCDMRIKDDNSDVWNAVWSRKVEKQSLFGIERIIGHNRIGLDGYLTIIGHTPLSDSKGFVFDEEENVINIDGGCAAYAVGQFEYDHVPLVEIEDGRLSFLTFNHNNEIISGYYYNGVLYPMDDKELDLRRVFLNRGLDGMGRKNKLLIKKMYEE